MPFSSITNAITRAWAFVDRFASGQAALRADLDEAMDDTVASINAALSYFDGRIDALETADRWYLGVHLSDELARAAAGGAPTPGHFYIRNPEMSLRVYDNGVFRPVTNIGDLSPYMASFLAAQDDQEAAAILGLGTAAFESAEAYARLSGSATFTGNVSLEGGTSIPGGITGDVVVTKLATGGDGAVLEMRRGRGTEAPQPVGLGDVFATLRVMARSAAEWVQVARLTVTGTSATAPYAARAVLRLGAVDALNIDAAGNVVTGGNLSGPWLRQSTAGMPATPSDAQVPSLKLTQQHVASVALAMGAIPQNVTANRTHSTTYTNETGGWMAVAVHCVGVGSSFLQTSPDGVSWVFADIAETTTGVPNVAHALVPPGHRYRISSAATIVNWIEVRPPA